MAHRIDIRHELRSGDLGRIVALHGVAYATLPGFGLGFEAYVARTIAEYVLDNDANGRIWLAEQDKELVGCAAMVLRGDALGQLRWVLVDTSARGKGLGKKLVNHTIDYARDQACSKIFLETTDGLPESQQLYETLGFDAVSNAREEMWDGVRPLIRMELTLA